jgi:hypothetical protein
MSIRIAQACVALFLSAGIVFGDDASHLDKAREYIQITKMDERMSQMTSILTQSLNQMFDQQLTQLKLPAEAAAVVRDSQSKLTQLLSETLKWESWRGEVEELTVRSFTEKELADIIAFYKTPSGQAMVAKTQALMEAGAAIGQRRAAAMQPQIEQVQRELAVKLQEILKAQPA